jgi:hypothetical protein
MLAPNPTTIKRQVSCTWRSPLFPQECYQQISDPAYYEPHAHTFPDAVISRYLFRGQFILVIKEAGTEHPEKTIEQK